MRSAWRAGLLLCAASSLLPAAARGEARRYVLDPRASRTVIHVGRAGLLGFAGHEHEVAAPAVRGAVDADPAELARASVELTFDAGGLRVTGAGEPAKDVADVQRTMLGPEVLDVLHFPRIAFRSTAVNVVGEDAAGARLTIHGTLTLHGVTRPIAVAARVEFKGDAVEATGTVTLRQSDFGIRPISKAGVVKVKDELDVSWRLVGRAR